jgi:hypothetical protein
VFVISHQIDDLISRNRRLIDQPLDYLGTVGASIHVVAKVHQGGAFRRPRGDILGDDFVQGNEAVETAVDIAYGIDTLSGWQGRGGSDEFNHDRIS